MTASASIERATTDGDFPVRAGMFIAVVGQSGAGKDTIIGYARERFEGTDRVDFIRRTITRPSDASSEDHDSLDDPTFDEALTHGAFALSWEAHGLKYGLPASVDNTITGGRVAVANMSRGAVAVLRERYANITVVEITAKPEIVAERLAGRGRESRGEVLARLARTAVSDLGPSLVRIDNSGPPELAGEKFVTLIRDAIAQAEIGKSR